MRLRSIACMSGGYQAKSFSYWVAPEGLKRTFNQAINGRGFQHHAQIVELFELLKIKRQPTPAVTHRRA